MIVRLKSRFVFSFSMATSTTDPDHRDEARVRFLGKSSTFKVYKGCPASRVQVIRSTPSLAYLKQCYQTQSNVS